MKLCIRKYGIVFVVSMLFFSFSGCFLENIAGDKEAAENQEPKDDESDLRGGSQSGKEASDMNKLIIGNTTLIIVKDDITKMKVDAIVNAANEQLKGGSGVNGAIGKAAGQGIYDECAAILKKRKISKLPTGDAVITSAGKMTDVKYIIHTPGPVWKGGKNNEAKLLKASYTNSLKLAQQKECKTVAFPSISTGIFNYPLEQAVKIAVSSVIDVIEKGEYEPEKIIFVMFGEKGIKAYQDVFAEIKDKK